MRLHNKIAAPNPHLRLEICLGVFGFKSRIVAVGELGRSAEDNHSQC